MYPCALSWTTSSGCNSCTSPTWPRSTSPRYLRATSIRPSLPLSPTACPPSRMIIDTIALFVRPARTISTTSIVSASVTRSPWTNFDSFPRRSRTRVISGPPPWTSTGWMPAPLRRTRSCTSVPPPLASSTLPPNLTPTVFPCQAFTYRRPCAITAPCSATAPVTISGKLPGIFLDILLREIAGPDGRFPAPHAEIHRHLHVLPRQMLAGLLEALRPAHAGAALRDHARAAFHRDSVRLHVHAGVADRGHDPPPVGSGAVNRGLHQQRVRHRPGGALGVLLGLRAGHRDLDQLGRPFPIAGDGPGQPTGQDAQRGLKRVQRV